jgi:hypothetical protein
VRVHDVVRWRCRTRVEKYADDAAHAAGEPYEVIEEDGNLLMYGGTSALWHRLTGGTTLTAFDNTNAYIGVGDSSAAAAATQTDLQAATNKLRRGMEATYPQHTDGTGSSNATVSFKSSFGASDANFAWNEWALFNASSAGRMLNRRVTALGTKTSGTTWTLTISLSLA